MKRVAAWLLILLLIYSSLASAQMPKRAFNGQMFPGLVSPSSLEYEDPVLDCDLDTSSGGSIHFNSCTQVEAVQRDQIASAAYPWLRLLSINCLALKRYSDSRVASRTFFPACLTKELIAAFPATVAGAVGPDDLKQRQGKTLRAYEAGLHISVAFNGEVRVRTAHSESIYVVIARADFDGDGNEDLLMRIDWSARDALGNGSDLVLISKKSAAAPIVVSWRYP